MDSRLTKQKAIPKPLLLKDYLLDDMSSCSSNGFKSFPRRQCCTSTVRFLIEIDLKNMKQPKKYFIFNKSPPALLRNPSKSALSAFQSVVTAVKRLPLAGASSPAKKNVKKSILPRNLSKKILKKSTFWKRKSNHEEIERWKSFDQLQKEESEPLDIPNSSMTTTSDSKNKSWSESDFTASDVCSSGNSSSEVNLNLTEVRNDAVEVLKNGAVSTDSTTSSDSSATNSSTKPKQWSVNEEKEQFSPVSVLDCPFDDDEEVSSPYQHMEGTKKKLMEKIQRYGCLAQLEPVNLLAKRFALLPDSDNEFTGSPLPHSSASIAISSIEKQEDDGENQAEQRALNLHNQFVDTLPSYGLKIKADKLLLDFFREKIIGQNSHSQRHSFDEELLEDAENWINGRKPHELFLGWEVPRNRLAYIKDIEKAGEWKSLDQEIQEVVSELEAEVFAALLHELLLDISSTTTV